MLKVLTIQNFALIEALELQFAPGLNIITGETGAGKSIIVDALMMVLGERASSDMIRHQAEKAVIEGVFSTEGNSAVGEWLQSNNYESFGKEIIVRRELTLRGTSRCFVNDSPASVSIVRELGDLLVDFHGQHDHQSLLKPESHLQQIDIAGGTETIRREYEKAYEHLTSLIGSLESLLRRETTLRQQQDYQQFQLDEIEAVSPLLDEEETLTAELAIIENSEYLHQTTKEIYSILYDDENSLRDRYVRVRNLLGELQQIDKSFTEFYDECQSAIVITQEIAKFAQNYNSRIEFQPERLDIIRERLGLLQRLRKKYGTLEAVFEEWDKLKSELALVENFEREIARLRQEILQAEKVLGGHAMRLSGKRKEIAQKVEKSIISILKTLGILHAEFKVVIRQSEAAANDVRALVDGKYYTAYADGVDRAEFFISTNIGEEPKPLAKVASGGEISRVMLALKSILAKQDRLPMLVFDEIDTGISGRISQKVGIAMKKLAAFHQIIAITHQPQIAALADAHLSVIKIESEGRSKVTAAFLPQEKRIREIAKLLSGEKITEASLESARELMQVKD
ncbi:MAG: DNA repair protein RecN [Candidatus Kapaibacterium sp.]